MTKESAFKINGCRIYEMPVGSGDWVAQEDLPDGVGCIRAIVHTKKEKVAVHLLVDEIYRQNRAIAMKLSDFRCKLCGCMSSLTCHHDKGRTRGRRDDRPEALEVLCLECHEKEHNPYAYRNK